MSFESVAYTAMLLGATGNVGGRILHLLVQNPLCKKVVVVTRRNVVELANSKVQQVVVKKPTTWPTCSPARLTSVRSERRDNPVSSNFLNAPFFWPELIWAEIPRRQAWQ
jgi:hypothetical protein